MENKGNIGIFDSGLGGLWIMKHLREKLPEYNYIFLGDHANMPYGDKTEDELFDLAIGGLDYLYGDMNCSGVILACNTLSSTIYERLREWKDKKYFGKILFGILHPTLNSLKGNKDTVIFATPRTCKSKVYEDFFKNNLSNYKKIPMPELAKVIEEGGDSHSYISSFAGEVSDTAERGALLCTHYGIVKDDFKNIFPKIKEWIYQEDLIPKYIEEYFKEFKDREAFFTRGGELTILTTKQSDIFNEFARKWFGEIKTQVINL